MHPENQTTDADREFIAGLKDSYRGIEVSPVDVDVLHASARRTDHRRVAVGGAALLAAAAVTVAVVTMPWGGAPTPPSGPVAGPLVVQEQPAISEAWPSRSRSDWMRYADVVVVAKVTAEHETGTYGAGDGSGEVAVGREVDLEVSEVLWSRGLGEAPTEVVGVSTAGWLDRPGQERARIAVDGVPRLELDHSYVLALRDTDNCGDAGGGSGWEVLGSSAAWPADSGTVGVGESGGRQVDGDADQAVPGSWEQQMMNRPVSEVRQALRAAEPADRVSDPC